jgi:molecular chaperone GrpE
MKEDKKNVSEAKDNINDGDSHIKDETIEDGSNEIKEEPVKEVIDEITLLVKENERLNDLLLRSKAELDNFQKRSIKQLQQAQLYSTEKLSSELMTIMDSLETVTNFSSDSSLKLENFIEGNSLLLKTAKEVFEKLEIEEINPINEVFDPKLHQAMATKDSDSNENTVLEVMQKGYKLKSKLLRPALVIVSKKVSKKK